MRPLRLDVEGFTCYRERQQPLDFSSMSLFAIAGPTGAGKSSVLDTMLYALYGVVPRVGKQAIGEFISHGRDSMSVCLDFRVSGRDYRVTRRVKRPTKGALKTSATLAELVGGVEKGLADNVKPVNEAVAAVLGLGYDEFIQTVVLPQGDFAKFLKAQPTDQRAILQHLLRHDVFMRMRDEAERRRKQVAGQMDVIEGKLTTYEGATLEALAALETSLTGALAELEAAGVARDAADGLLADAQERHRLTQQVAELRTRLVALDQQGPAVEDAREQLERARRAAPVAPLVEAARLASTAIETAARTRTEMVAAVHHATTARSKAASVAEAASLAARECPEVERCIQALDEIAGDLTQRVQLADALAAMPPRLAAADREVEAARKAAATARNAVAQVQTRQQSLAAQRDGTAFDEALHARMEGVFPTVVEARAIHGEVLSLIDEEERATRAHATAQRAEADTQAARDAAQRALARATEDADAARAALDEGRVTHAAAAIRAHLHEGDACPVCLQTVDTLPRVPVTAALAALEGAARVAVDREKTAERAHQQAVTAAAQATALVSAAADALASVAQKHESRRAACASLIATITAAMPDAIGTATGGSGHKGKGTALAESDVTLLDQVEQRLGALRHAKVERDRHSVALQTAAAELAEATLTLAHAESGARAVEASGEQLRAEQSRLQRQLDEVVARIRAVTTTDDPKAERAALARQVVERRDAEGRAREALTAADLAVTAATERLRAADGVSSNCEVALITSRAQLTAALAEAAFAGAEEVARALRTPAAQAALQKTVTAHDEQRALVGHQLAALEPKVTGREVSADTLAAAVRHRAEALARWQTASQQVATLQSDETRLRKDLAARLALISEREALGTTLEMTTEMANDLKSDGFQDYLLEEAFLSLVSGASIRMREISNRYTLDWCDSEFHVVDHDNAGERRRADTLSGGETFMASLCLALQLSETVLQASGALQMDSLFVDEGFGTLDSDALAEVTDAIERLGRDGQRMVGVISHREELTDRLPGLIRIEKGMGESRWRVERVG